MSTAEATPTRSVRYQRSDRQWVVIEVPIAVHRALEASDRAIRRQDQRYRETHATLSILTPAGQPEREPSEAEGRAHVGQRGSNGEWDGPKVSFSQLVGLDVSWPVTPVNGKCGACGDRELPNYAVCLRCCRVSPAIQALIPGLSKREREQLAMRERLQRRQVRELAKAKALEGKVISRRQRRAKARGPETA